MDEHDFKRLVSIWKSMIQRFTNPNRHSYKDYGAKGHYVCEELRSLHNFIKWALENGYTHVLQLHIDDNGNYELSCCRWVTYKENSNNKTNNRQIILNGKTKNLSEWTEQIGVNKKTITDRLERGWTHDEALLGKRQRKNVRKNTGQKLTINEVTKSYGEWASIIGISYNVLKCTLCQGQNGFLIFQSDSINSIY